MERFNGRKLMDIAGLNEDQVAGLAMVSPMHRGKHWICVAGHTLRASHSHLQRPKVCPDCLAENSRCESFWELSLVVACPVHRRTLIDHCDSCGKRIRWARAKVSACSCGADYRTMGSREPVSDEVVALMAAIRAGLYGQAWPDLMTQFESLGVVGLLDLAGLLCAKMGKGQDSRERRAFHRLSGQISHTATLLAHWPTALHAYLEDSYPLDGLPILPTPRSIFPWAWAHRTLNEEVHSLLLREVLPFMVRHWHPQALVKIAGTDLPPLDRFRWGSLSDLRVVSGLHHATINRMVAAGVVPTRSVMRSRDNAAKIYSMEWARSAANDKENRIELRAAAKRIGMTVRVLRTLREDGICGASNSGAGLSLFTLKDLEDLGQRLFSRIRIGAMPPRSVPRTLKHLLRSHRRTVSDKAFFVRAILDGDLPVWRGKSDWVGDLLLCNETATECLLYMGQAQTRHG